MGKFMTTKATKKRSSKKKTYPEHLSLIGSIITETVYLEWVLSGLFARMMGLSFKVARAIYLTPKSETARLEILQNASKALFEEKSAKRAAPTLQKQKDAAKKEVQSLIKRSQNIINERHRLVHDLWEERDALAESCGDPLKRRRIDAEKLHEKPKEISIDDLKSLHCDIEKLIGDVHALRLKFKKHPPYYG